MAGMKYLSDDICALVFVKKLCFPEKEKMFVTSIDCLADSVAPLANALHLMLGNLNGLLKRETVLQEMEWHCGPFG